METLPREIIRVLRPFEAVLSERVWDWVTVLLVGAILAPGQRTVAAVLRVMGLSDERQFQNYHRVLNRARWSSRELGRRLLVLLVRVFVPADATVVVGLDDSIERRRGAKIAAKGIYRDPVRSSKEHFVKASGLRWVSLQLLACVPWAQQVWALPFFTVLAPSERYHQERGQRHKTLPDWGRQMLCPLRRWRPDPSVVAVADSTSAALALLAACARLRHPGVETQRQWSDRAIQRTTPALLGLFSLVTLLAHELLPGHALPARQAAWYTKPLPTFGDTLALVRRELWAVPVFALSSQSTDMIEIPRSRWDRVTNALAYAV